MKAIILAAGIGSRLQPMTNKKPKTLVDVNGKPMLGHIIDAINSINEVDEIIICTGFESSQIVNYCETNYKYNVFQYINNKDFQDTNNMYSLYLAKDFIDGDFLLMNADLVFDVDVIKGLFLMDGSAVAVDKGNYLEESMKVTVGKDGFILGISKKIKKEKAYGCSIDVYKISDEDSEKLISEMEDIIENQKDLNQWTEVVLDNLFRENKIKAKPFNIGKSRWYEIDNYKDLSKAEILFNENIKKLKSKKVYFIDRDGTLTLGGEVINGASDFIEKLKKKDKHFFVTTNNSSKSPREHFNKLKSIGLNIEEENILVSIQAAIKFLKESNKKRIFWVANKGVSSYLESEGLVFDDEKPQAILLTYDDQIDYRKLRKISYLVRKGIPYYATHCDIVCPSREGPIPDIGTFIKVIEMTAGKTPNKIFGKPNKNSIKPSLDELGLKFEDAVIIGDRLYTDISLAENSDVTSILVLTGETTREEYEESDIRSDIIISDLDEIIKYI